MAWLHPIKPMLGLRDCALMQALKRCIEATPKAHLPWLAKRRRAPAWAEGLGSMLGHGVSTMNCHSHQVKRSFMALGPSKKEEDCRAEANITAFDSHSPIGY